ncbi:MAG: hypothetical protein IT372_26520 [Polyangiaceae bacterium]|nr:hypothetical protein [Polyangiaceae bacterium]
MSDEAADGELPQPGPSRKRRKRQQEAGAESLTTPRASEGEAEDRGAGAEADPAPAPASLRPEIPLFARGFPRNDELDRLFAAFERGDHAAVRAGAARLAKDAPDEDVRRAAAELLRRIEPDPLAVGLLLAAVALLVFLSSWYWAQAHASP